MNALLLLVAVVCLVWAVVERHARLAASRAGRVVRTENRDHVFGEADCYNLVEVQDTDGKYIVLAFTDDGKKNMAERAGKNPEDVAVALKR